MKNSKNAVQNKSNNNMKNAYDDGNIPEEDLPRNCHKCNGDCAEPLPESTRPRQDGPGGD